MLFYSLLFASCWSSAGAYGLRQKENPIRRIVTLLQDMQKEIETEGDTQGQKRVYIRARESSFCVVVVDFLLKYFTDLCNYQVFSTIDVCRNSNKII